MHFVACMRLEYIYDTHDVAEADAFRRVHGISVFGRSMDQSVHFKEQLCMDMRNGRKIKDCY